jgi:hypothetical protein
MISMTQGMAQEWAELARCFHGDGVVIGRKCSRPARITVLET